MSLLPLFSTETQNMPDNYYWDTKQETQVKKYITDESLTKPQRDRIYREHLHEPFQEMIIALIHTYKIYNTEYGNKLEDLISDVTCRVYEVLEESRKDTAKYYNPQEGKAFSYFSVVIKFYLIGKENEYLDKNIQTDSLNSEDCFIEPSISPEQPTHQAINYTDFYTKLMNWISTNGVDLFAEQGNREIAAAVINTMQNRTHLLNDGKSFKGDVEDQLTTTDHANFDTKYYRVKAIINRAFRKLKKIYKQQGTFSVEVEL